MSESLEDYIAEPKPQTALAVQPEPKQRLKELRSQIRAAHAAVLANESGARGYSKAALESAMACGKDLDEAQMLLPYGQFEKWVKANCDISKTTAYNWRQLVQHSEQVRDCNSIREALMKLGLIKAPKVIERKKEDEPKQAEPPIPDDEKEPEVAQIKGEQKDPMDQVRGLLKKIDTIFQETDIKGQIIADTEAHVNDWKRMIAEETEAFLIEWKKKETNGSLIEAAL